MSVLGNAVVRLEDPRFVAGGGRFVDDIRVDGAAHAVWVRSDEAHALLVGVDTSEAAALPAVVVAESKAVAEDAAALVVAC